MSGVGESWCTAGVVTRAGVVVLPSVTVHNSWLLPGRRKAANLVHGGTGGTYQPFIWIGLGTSNIPNAVDREQSDLGTPIGPRKSTITTPASTNNSIGLDVSFFGDELPAMTGPVGIREVGLFNAMRGGELLYRYVYPVALPLAPDAVLPIHLSVNILELA